MGNDSIDMIILDIDMGYLVTLVQRLTMATAAKAAEMAATSDGAQGRSGIPGLGFRV
jgi:hypothetical protein